MPHTLPTISWPNKSEGIANLQSPASGAIPLLLAETHSSCDTPLLILTNQSTNNQHLAKLITELSTINPRPIHCLPSWETLPYDRFSPHDDLSSERMKTLLNMSTLTTGTIITSASTALYKLPPNDFFATQAFSYKQGQIINLTKLCNKLHESGYRAVSTVMAHGEFAHRGSVLDIFPMGANEPFRLDFFDDEIESIHNFNPENQRSTKTHTSVQLLPAEEYPLNEEAITKFRQNWRTKFSGNPAESNVYQQITNGQAAPGAEYYLPLFFANLDSLFDYMPENCKIILLPDAIESATNAWELAWQRYDSLRHDQTHPLCEPNEIALSPESFTKIINAAPTVQLDEKNAAEADMATAQLPNLQIEHKKKEPLTNLKEFISAHSEQGGRVAVCAESAGRREVLHNLLLENHIEAKQLSGWSDFLNDTTPACIITAAFTSGFITKSHKIACITEAELFARQLVQTSATDKTTQTIDPAALIRNLVELKSGDPVVHQQHGVGRYQGLTSLVTDGIESEYLLLTYANEDKLYVPVTSLQLISRYLGADAQHSPLNRLGSNQWQQTTEKAKKRLRDIAAELLIAYSRRQQADGFAFSEPDHEFSAFRSSFPFEETPDQRKAINATINDMASPQVMDRLVCGDVGFGKTEVAMQAAFLAIQNNKQVMLLAPTTLLANQHIKTCQDRFSEWPIRIALCSRAVTGKKQTELFAQLQSGSIDLVIGTHKLLSKNIQFKNLGLMIVDEEHRFGVAHKERIKAMKANIDILTMTATPIPRTLNFSLSKLRDLSIIATPPAQRLAIKTFVRHYQSELIKEAITREINRGGQVYFLHNDINSMPEIESKLLKMIPGLRTTIAHGQLREKELEEIMADFYHLKYQVLITTTIVESGIDVPNANTIIINNADKFGLAQLHQLRGRVGRSHHQAYAYLLTDRHKKLTRDAQKRLEALEALTDLGAGFQLAMQDLEIRGAGEILGEEQSGHIQKVGFSLYLDMLDEAVRAIDPDQAKQGRLPSALEADIDLGISALLTHQYIPDVAQRLTLYKRLSGLKTESTVNDFKGELIDRFGPLPIESEQLITVTKLKLLATELGVKKIRIGREFGAIDFSDTPNIDSRALIKMVQLQPKKYQLNKRTQLRYTLAKEKNISPDKQLREILLSLKTID